MPACTAGPSSPSEAKVPARAAEHRDEDARRRLLQPLDMADQLVDPHRDLEAERRRHRVLAVRAAGDRHVGAALGEIGGGGQRVADQAQEDAVRLAQHQQVAGLRDVLRRRAPMHPAAMRLADDARQFPDQRHDRVAGAGEALVDALAVEQVEPRRGGDRLGRLVRDDAELGLRLGQRGLDIEPGLPAVFHAVEGADAGIGHPRGGRQFVAHRAVSRLRAASISRMSGRCSLPQNNSPSITKLGTPNTPFSSASREIRATSRRPVAGEPGGGGVCGVGPGFGEHRCDDGRVLDVEFAFPEALEGDVDVAAQRVVSLAFGVQHAGGGQRRIPDLLRARGSRGRAFAPAAGNPCTNI